LTSELGGHDDGLFGAMCPHQFPGCAHVDDMATVDDRDTVAEPLRFLHQMSGEQDGLAALTDAAHHLPDREPCLRVETGRQLVEHHDIRIVNERERDEEPLLLPA